MLLERLPDMLPSLGSDPNLLLALKVHSGLPTMSSWTEADPTLSLYLDAAEKMVDKLCGCPFRVRSFKLSLTDLYNACGAKRRYFGLKLPAHPVVVASTSVVVVDALGFTTTYLEGTDYGLYGPASLTPEIIFNTGWQKPSTDSPYPYTVLFQAGGTGDVDVAQMAIFELASYFYKNPEALRDSNPNPSIIFDAHIDFLKGSFL